MNEHVYQPKPHGNHNFPSDMVLSFPHWTRGWRNQSRNSGVAWQGYKGSCQHSLDHHPWWWWQEAPAAALTHDSQGLTKIEAVQISEQISNQFLGLWEINCHSSDSFELIGWYHVLLRVKLRRRVNAKYSPPWPYFPQCHETKDVSGPCQPSTTSTSAPNHKFLANANTTRILAIIQYTFPSPKSKSWKDVANIIC